MSEMIRGYLHWQGQPYFLVWSILSDRLTNINQSFCKQVTFKRYQLLISRFFQILNHAVVGIMINLNCYFKKDGKVGCTSVKQGNIMYIWYDFEGDIPEYKYSDITLTQEDNTIHF